MGTKVVLRIPLPLHKPLYASDGYKRNFGPKTLLTSSMSTYINRQVVSVSDYSQSS